MPELPEVEMVRRGLERLIVTRRIADVTVLNEKSFPIDQAGVSMLAGAEVVAIRRYAKVLVIDLGTGYSLVVHLKMTGQMVFRDEDAAEPAWGAGHPTASFLAQLPDRSTRVIFELGNTGENAGENVGTVPVFRVGADPGRPQPETQEPSPRFPARLFFNDQRKFGWIRLIASDRVTAMEFIAKLGPEPLDRMGRQLSKDQARKATVEFISRARRHAKASVKAVILNQAVIAGVGNIYADEALWAAGVHPATPVRDLSDEQLATIFDQAGRAMLESLAAGGSTLRTYFQPDGTPGSYLEAFANVFARQGQPCPKCGASIEKHRLAGRGTHLCPHCQTLPLRP